MHVATQNSQHVALTNGEDAETPAIAGYGKIGQNWDADAEVEVLYADDTLRPRFVSLEELSPEGAIRVTTGKGPTGEKSDRNRIPEWRLDPGRASAAAKALEKVIQTYESEDPVRNPETILCGLLKEAKAELEQPFSYFRTRRTSVVVHGGRTLDIESATEQKRRNSTSSVVRLEKSNVRNDEEHESAGPGTLKRRESEHTATLSRRYNEHDSDETTFQTPNPPSTTKKRRKSLAKRIDRANFSSESEDEMSLSTLSSDESASSPKIRARLPKISPSVCDDKREKEERRAKNLNRAKIIKTAKSASRACSSLKPRDSENSTPMQRQKRNEGGEPQSSVIPSSQLNSNSKSSLQKVPQNESSIVEQLRTWKRPNVRYGTGKKKSANGQLTNVANVQCFNPSLAQIPSNKMSEKTLNEKASENDESSPHFSHLVYPQTPGPETSPGAYAHHEKQSHLSEAHQRADVDTNASYPMSTPLSSYISPAATPCWTCLHVRNPGQSKTAASTTTNGPIPHKEGGERLERYAEDEILLRQHEDLKDALMTCIRRTLTGPSKRLRDENAMGSVRGSFGDNSLNNGGSDVVTLHDHGGDQNFIPNKMVQHNGESRKNKMDIGHILAPRDPPSLTRTPPSPESTGLDSSSSDSVATSIPSLVYQTHPYLDEPSVCTETGSLSSQNEIFRAEEEKLVRMVRRLVLAARHSWDARLVETEGLAPWIGGIDKKDDDGKGEVRM